LYRLPENDATPIGKHVSQPFFDTISGQAEEGLSDWKSPDGVTRIMAFKQLRLKENLPPYFYISVGLPKGPILHKANMNMLENLSILGFAGLLAMSLAWVFGNLVLIVSPLIGWSLPASDSAWARWTHVRVCPTAPMN
jgi:hypothetical protein